MTPRLDLMTNSEATEYLREVWQANRGLVGEERFQRRFAQRAIAETTPTARTEFSIEGGTNA